MTPPPDPYLTSVNSLAHFWLTQLGSVQGLMLARLSVSRWINHELKYENEELSRTAERKRDSNLHPHYQLSIKIRLKMMMGFFIILQLWWSQRSITRLFYLIYNKRRSSSQLLPGDSFKTMSADINTLAIFMTSFQNLMKKYSIRWAMEQSIVWGKKKLGNGGLCCRRGWTPMCVTNEGGEGICEESPCQDDEESAFVDFPLKRFPVRSHRSSELTVM